MITECVQRLRTRLAVAFAASVVSADGPGQQRVHDVVRVACLRILPSTLPDLGLELASLSLRPFE